MFSLSHLSILLLSVKESHLLPELTWMNIIYISRARARCINFAWAKETPRKIPYKSHDIPGNGPNAASESTSALSRPRAPTSSRDHRDENDAFPRCSFRRYHTSIHRDSDTEWQVSRIGCSNYLTTTIFSQLVIAITILLRATVIVRFAVSVVCLLRRIQNE